MVVGCVHLPGDRPGQITLRILLLNRTGQMTVLPGLPSELRRPATAGVALVKRPN